jgi:hypothetical protein
LGNSDLRSIDGQSPLEQERESSYSAVSESKKYAPKQFWNSQIKAAFNEVSPKYQKAWLESFNLAEKSYNKMVKSLKETYLELDDVAGVLAPYVHEITKNLGMSPASYLQSLIEADREATTNPVDYILKIMAVRGVSLRNLEDGVNPLLQKANQSAAIQPIINRINELESRLASNTQPQSSGVSRSEIEDAAQQIRDYFSQTDSSGRSLYPNAVQMYNDIVDHLSSGEASSLDEAYDLAAQKYKAQIPASEFRDNSKVDRHSSYDDNYANVVNVSGALEKKKEKSMLQNLADQISARY